MVEVMTDKATVEIPAPRAGTHRPAHVRRRRRLPGRQGPGDDRDDAQARGPRARRRAAPSGRARPWPPRVPAAAAAPVRRPRAVARDRQRDGANGVGARGRSWRRRRRASWRASWASTSAGRRAPGAPAASPRTTCVIFRLRRGRTGRAPEALRRCARPRLALAASARRRRRAHPVPRRAPAHRRAHGALDAHAPRTTPTSRRSTAPSWSSCATGPTSGWRRSKRQAVSYLPFIIKATVAALKRFPS